MFGGPHKLLLKSSPGSSRLVYSHYGRKSVTARYGPFGSTLSNFRFLPLFRTVYVTSRASFPEPRNSLCFYPGYATHDTRQRRQCRPVVAFYRPTAYTAPREVSTTLVGNYLRTRLFRFVRVTRIYLEISLSAACYLCKFVFL